MCFTFALLSFSLKKTFANEQVTERESLVKGRDKESDNQ
jgi:hypothetical protein